jgi:hypothetical protein
MTRVHMLTREALQVDVQLGFNFMWCAPLLGCSELTARDCLIHRTAFARRNATGSQVRYADDRYQHWHERCAARYGPMAASASAQYLTYAMPLRAVVQASSRLEVAICRTVPLNRCRASTFADALAKERTRHSTKVMTLSGSTALSHHSGMTSTHALRTTSAVRMTNLSSMPCG